MHGTRVAPMPGRGSRGDLPGEGDDAETKDAGVELAAAAPLDRSASDLSTAADGRGSEYHRHLDEEDRAAYSSELMQHALLKAGQAKLVAEFPTTPAMVDDDHDITTNEIVIKENRGQVIIERLPRESEGADFKYDRAIFDPMHRNQQHTFIARSATMMKPGARRTETAAPKRQGLSSHTLIRQFATRMHGTSASPGKKKTMSPDDVEKAALASFRQSQAKVGEGEGGRRDAAVGRRSHFNTIISTGGDIVGVKRVDPWDVSDFPRQRDATVRVFNPNGTYRCYWDLFMAIILLYAGLVTPFVIAFVAECSGKACTHFYVELVIDLCFLADLLSNFNTGYFHNMEQRWVIDRYAIAKRYVGSAWFYVDVISIFPFREATPKAGGSDMELVRAMKILRLVKIVRVLKIKRIADTYWNYIFLSYHTQAVIKFISFMLVVAHWTACLIRTLSEKTGDKDKKSWLQNHGLYRQGMWAEYLAAMVWAVQALNGTAVVYTVHEHFAAVVVLLVGCVVIAFMIGEIANVLTSLDPANNQYKMTMDLLGIFMNERGLERGLKRQLRSYFVQCEQVFRERCYKEMLENLTPQYREQIAVQNIGPWVRSLRVVQDAVVRASKIHPGMLVAVERTDIDYEADPEKGRYRGAWVVRVHKHRALLDLCFQEEMPRIGEKCKASDFRMGVDFDRVTIPRFTPQGYAWHSSMNAYRGLVAELALILEPAVYIAHELIIQEGQENTNMFLLIRGNCLKTFKGLPMCWPKSTLVEDSSFACLGDDMMSCLVTNRRFSRRFIVRAVTKVQLYSMGREGFMKKVYMASCDVLRKHMLRYVFWELFHDTLWYRKELIAVLLDKYRKKHGAPRRATRLSSAARPPKMKRSMAPASGFNLLLKQKSAAALAADPPPKPEPPTLEPVRSRRQKGLSFRTGFRIAETPTLRNLREDARTKKAMMEDCDEDDAGDGEGDDDEEEEGAPRSSVLGELPRIGKKTQMVPGLLRRLPSARIELNTMAEELHAAMDRCRDAVDAEVDALQDGSPSDQEKLKALRTALLAVAAEAAVALGDLNHVQDTLLEQATTPRPPPENA